MHYLKSFFGNLHQEFNIHTHSRLELQISYLDISSKVNLDQLEH